MSLKNMNLTQSSQSGGSNTDLTKLPDESEQMKVTQRKRKQPDHECNISVQLADFRNEIMSLLTSFTRNQKSQTKTLNKISEDIEGVKQEIANLQTCTQSLSSGQTQLKADIEDLKTTAAASNTKIISLESDVNLLKGTACSMSQPVACEEMVMELQERTKREKNIIIVGIPESNIQNTKERIINENKEVTKILKTILPDCPEPEKVIRLGKYSTEKNRPLKVTLTTPEVAKSILRKQSLWTENDIKIYSDQTPQQQNYIKQLQNELQKRTQAGEDNLIIKYFHGIPKITKSQAKNEVQVKTTNVTCPNIVIN